jgi:RecA/RadA recombinase
MARKLGQASANFVSNRQSPEVNNMMNDFMNQLGIQAGSIRDLSSDEEKLEMVPTGIQNLDVALKGGVPTRTIVELYGESGGGKSWLAQKIAAGVTYEGGRCFFIDAELAFNPFRAQDIGLDLDLVTYWDGFDNGEQVMEMISKLLDDPKWDKPYNQPKPYSVIILDSIAVLPTRTDMEADLAGVEKDGPKVRVASKATMMSQTLKKMQPSFSHSPGAWLEEMSTTRYHNETLLLDKSSIPEDVRKELTRLAKRRAPHKYDLFKPEVQEEIGEIPPEIVQFERSVTGQVVEVMDGGLVVMHDNPGPVFIIVNQTRFADFGNYGGAKKKTTGGQALLFFAGTRINIEPVSGSVKKAGVFVPKSEVHDPVTNELTHYLSKVRIIKSRYTTRMSDIMIKIPVGETKDDIFDDFRSMLKDKKMYDYSRGYHKMYLDPEEDPVIRTKDNEEFLELMLSVGIDIAASKLNIPDEQVLLLKQHCEEKLEQVQQVEIEDDEEEEESDED